MRHRPRQGQCRWHHVVYKPGTKFVDELGFVACIYPCYVTNVTAKTVHYDCGFGDEDPHPFLCGFGFWKKLHPTRRAAERAAIAELAMIAASKGGK